jgi:hypothetical protein
MQITNTAPRIISFIAPSGLIMLTPLDAIYIDEGDRAAARAALSGALRPFVTSRELHLTLDASRLDEAPGRALDRDNPMLPPTVPAELPPPQLEPAETSTPTTTTPAAPPHAAAVSSSKRKT